MNATQSFSATLSASQQLFLLTSRLAYYNPGTRLLPSLSDHLLSLLLPVAVYWVYSGFFHLLDLSAAEWLEKYRLHPSAEMASRNLATRGHVVRTVIIQHTLQTIVGILFVEATPLGEEVNHLGIMGSMTPTVFSLLRGILSESAGAKYFAMYGHQILYTMYWWAIPIARILVAM